MLEEAARTIGDAAHAIGATLDAPEDEDRLLDACEAIVTARARLHALRDAPVRSRDAPGTRSGAAPAGRNPAARADRRPREVRLGQRAAGFERLWK